MPYAAEISRVNPSCFLFVIDQSGSMGDAFGGPNALGRSKAQELADAINRLLQNLVTRCAKGEEVRDYFEVGVIGYGQSLGPALQGPLGGRDLVSISEIAFNPVRMESRVKKVSDGAGGLVEQAFSLPVWIEAAHNGGTPMCEALRKTKSILETWAAAHIASYPPTVIHITDGESTDGDPSSIGAEIKAISTQDGGVCLLNLHHSSSQAKPISFPESDANLPDQFARLLFAMSTVLPAPIRAAAQGEGYPVTDATRGFAFNADLVEAIRFLDIGTRVTGLK